MSTTLQFVTPSSKTATFLSADHSANQAINQSNKQSRMDDCNPLRQQSVDDRDLDCFNSDSKRRTLPEMLRLYLLRGRPGSRTPGQFPGYTLIACFCGR